MYNSITKVTRPLDQFKVRNLIGINAPKFYLFILEMTLRAILAWYGSDFDYAFISDDLTPLVLNMNDPGQSAISYQEYVDRLSSCECQQRKPISEENYNTLNDMHADMDVQQELLDKSKSLVNNLELEVAARTNNSSSTEPASDLQAYKELLDRAEKVQTEIEEHMGDLLGKFTQQAVKSISSK